MAPRYFQVSCRNCSQQFSIQAEEGITVKCNCPFCGTESTVAVPLLSAKKAEVPYKQCWQEGNRWFPYIYSHYAIGIYFIVCRFYGNV